jgi:hypothetical protein
MTKHFSVFLILLWLVPAVGFAQSTGTITGRVGDGTGGVLPGVTVTLKSMAGIPVAETVTDGVGGFMFASVTPGHYQVQFTLINFASAIHPDLDVKPGTNTLNEVLQLSLNAEVTVIGKRTFTNLADVEDPAENLVGIAQSASQGAITARQLDVRPIMRGGEVLETVPGVIITQHSGEGKANQYFLRGFNLDHGSDFSTWVAGTPVNMPTHAHSQGYSDINFLIPELVAGVQYSKGPYFADQGDFTTAGAANINYATSLEGPIAHVEKGSYGYGRALFAASPKVGNGHVLAALEVSTNAGPWAVPDSYRKLNGVARFSQGNSVNGWSLTGMGYHGKWNATEGSPQRAIDEGIIGRFGSIDPTDGGRTGRYSASAEWQHGSGKTLTKVSAYGIKYDLNLISNFTFFLDDPVHGDQREQVDRRFVTGGRVSQRRLAQWRGRTVQNTFGVQVRNDNIMKVGLYHTEERQRLETFSEASALVTSGGVYTQNEIEWVPKLRTMLGLRADASHYKVDSFLPENSGTASAALVSPKGGVTLGPWKSTEFYVNGGTGFHSNNALGTTITHDYLGNDVERVTPLVRGMGGEVGVRSVAIPHLQSTVSLWTLSLDSELVYNGDIGATEPGDSSKRWGVEIANYLSPTKWLVFDADVSLSQARFTSGDVDGMHVPEAVGTVISAGASVDNYKRTHASLRWRYFGPRPLIEDNSIRSDATSLINFQGGYRLFPKVRLSVDIFNLFNTEAADITYWFPSRLPGEPLDGVDDFHIHPAVPRTVRAGFIIGF